MGSCISAEESPPYRVHDISKVQPNSLDQTVHRQSQVKHSETNPQAVDSVQIKNNPTLPAAEQDNPQTTTMMNKKKEFQKSLNQISSGPKLHPTTQLQQILKNKTNIIASLIEDELVGLSYSEEQMIEIAGQINNMKYDIPVSEKKKEKQKVNQLLKNGKQLDINTLVGEQEQSQSFLRIKSRILYHKGNDIAKDKYFKDFKIERVSNDEIEELMQYEQIEREVQKVAQNFYLKKIEIKDNTKDIQDLFTKCFSKHGKQLGDHDYFKLANGLKAAKFSRECCQYETKGIFIFLNYIVMTLWELESKGKPLSLIQEAASFLIENLSKLYPPGQNLIGGDERMEKILNELEVAWDKKNQPLKYNPLINFQSKSDKRDQLQKAVLEKAKIAEEELPYLQNIIRQTCLKKCIGVDSNLKLYVSKKNQKALVRITEKLLFKSEGQANDNLNNKMNKMKSLQQDDRSQIEKFYLEQINEILKKDTENVREQKISDHLAAEQKKYQEEVEKKLQSKESIEFSISDMVRGKCTFSNIEDIIETIDSIKEYVKNSQKIHPGRYRILEIESRFTKAIPISDITLKFALNQRIIAELQLTLQNNVATYAFAHKIYELQRSKAFSKVKTIFNYYYEYKDEFQDFLLDQIKISKFSSNQDAKTINEIAHPVIQFFQLSLTKKKVTLTDILNRTNNNQAESMGLKQAILVKAVFDRKMLKKNEERKKLFSDNFVPGKWSQIYLSALYYQVVKDFDLIAKLHEITGMNTTPGNYMSKRILGDDKIKEKDKAKFRRTIKIQIKKEELDQLYDLYQTLQAGEDIEDDDDDDDGDIDSDDGDIDSDDGDIDDGDKKADNNDYENEKFVEPLFKYEQLIVKIYGNRNEYQAWVMKRGIIYEECQKLQKALEFYNKALQVSNSSKEAEIQFSKARLFNKIGRFQEAKSLLQEIVNRYKEKKQYRNAMICYMLLSQCSIKQNNNARFEQLLDTAAKIRQMHKISFTGAEIANCQYRVGLEMIKHKQKQQLGIDVYIRAAFEEFSEYMQPIVLLRKAKQCWELYSSLKIKQPQFRANLDIQNLEITCDDNNLIDVSHLCIGQWPNIQQIYIDEKKMKIKQCSAIVKGKWPKLLRLELVNCQIEASGCQILAKGKWPQLTVLNLSENKINNQGCKHLIKGMWFCLKELALSSNSINQGCQYLIQGKWPQLSRLDLMENNLSEQGCRYLSQGSWLCLQQLQLQINKINAKGCNYLMQGKWPNLKQINLTQNEIGKGAFMDLNDDGLPHLQKLFLAENKLTDLECQFFSKGKWLSLTDLDFCSNKIGDKGCLYLSQRQWPSLQNLIMMGNKIKNQGCGHISQINSPNLRQLDLGENQIKDEGCEHLSLGKWPNLQSLNLQANKFSDQGCQQLAKGAWPNLNFLGLYDIKVKNQKLCKQILSKAFLQVEEFDF